MNFVIQDKEFTKQLCEIDVHEEKIFKEVIPANTPNKMAADDWIS